MHINSIVSKHCGCYVRPNIVILWIKSALDMNTIVMRIIFREQTMFY